MGLGAVCRVWNYSTKHLMSTREFESLEPCIVAYSPDGAFMALGCTNGTVRILNPDSLEDVHAFRFVTSKCMRMTFSGDSQILAVADANGYVSIVTFGHGRVRT